MEKHLYVSAEEALSLIQSNQRVFFHGSAATPLYLINELAKQKDRLRNVEIVSITLQGDIEITKPEYRNAFYINSLFVSTPIREAVNSGRADYIPVFLSDIPELFEGDILSLDVAVVKVSPPDKHGYCSLGTSVDIARTAVDNAKLVIGEVNPQMPRTHGDSMIHVKRFTKLVWHDEKLSETDYASKTTEDEMIIGRYIADLIEDRSTLQMGIGTIPDAVFKSLANHKNLGIHSEMISDGIIQLYLDDVVNNKYKKIHPNKTVTSFAVGTEKLYKVIDDNPSFAFLDIDYVNNPHVIMRNDRVVAINSAIEVDITGQICADSIGTYHYSGIGGQMDFMYGASLSKGGKPITAITSRTRKGLPRIVPVLKPGAGVVTTRGHAHYVVTEYGVAYLHGKNMRQRAKALIHISHPDDREALEKSCFERFKLF
jgi:acyl-CoA hydrolase